jgi:hypothetical protein
MPNDGFLPHNSQTAAISILLLDPGAGAGFIAGVVPAGNPTDLRRHTHRSGQDQRKG